IDAALGGEVEDELVAVPLPLGLGDLHHQAVVADHLAGLAADALLVGPEDHEALHLLRLGATDDALAGRETGFAGRGAARALLRRHAADALHAPEVVAPLHLDDDVIADAERVVRHFEVVAARALEGDLHHSRRVLRPREGLDDW